MVTEKSFGGEKVAGNEKKDKKTPLKMSGGESCQHYYWKKIPIYRGEQTVRVTCVGCN